MTNSAASTPVAGEVSGGLMPTTLRTYYVFLASPGDVQEERQAVRTFVDRFNRNQARFRGLRFEVLDWENYSSAGIGRPQELITQQTLERFRPSLAVVIGIMAQRFGSPSGTHESGTEEEFEWAVESWRTRGYPEVKWYFRKVEGLQLDSDPDKALDGLEQWRKVRAFRGRMDTIEPRLYTREYGNLTAFVELLDQDLGQWLNGPERPWSTGESAPGHHSASDDGLTRLAKRLDDAFVEQMRTGEALEAVKATARYIPLVFKIRKVAGHSEERTGLTEGRLEEFLAAERRLLLVGGGGGGKSTTLRHLAADAAGQALVDPASPIPVYVRLSSFDNLQDGLTGLLRLISLAMDVDLAQAEKMWRSGDRPLLFLFDGLNEVAHAHRETCTRALLTIVQGPHALHRYVVTSRPGGPLEQVAEQPTGGSGLVVLDLLSLRPEQISRYIQAEGRSGQYTRIQPHVEGLASSPFLLWAITRALESAPGGAVIHSRGGLLQHLIDYYIYEIRERAKPAPRPTTYDYRLVKKPVLARLALRMASDGRTAVAEDIVLWQAVLTHLREIEKIYEGIRELVPESFMPPNRTPIGLLEEIVDNGVLIREGGTLRFLHESVQEYFAAVAWQKERPDVLAERAPEVTLSRYGVNGSGFEIFVTLAGLLNGAAASALAVAVLSRNPLLAAHICQEAELHDTAKETVWNHYTELLDSRHEGRRRLGQRCLAVFPCSRPEVVRRLLRQSIQSADLRREAEDALNKVLSDDLLSTLVNEYLDGGLSLFDDPRADLLQGIGRERSTDVTRQLLSAWRPRDESDRRRLAELARYIDAKFRFAPQEDGAIDGALLKTAIEAESEGDHALAADANQLRDFLRNLSLPKGGLLRSAEELRELFRINSELRERMKALDDQAVAEMLTSEVTRERNLAFDELVGRGSILVAQTAVDRLLEAYTAAEGRHERWWQILAKLPRSAVVEALTLRAREAKTVGSRARTVLQLLELRPDGAMIEEVLRHEDESLRTLAAYAARRSPSALNLVEALAHEPSALVIEAAIDGLSTKGEPATTSVLLDLLFNMPLVASPERDPDELIDDDSGMTVRFSDWDRRIHQALVNGGARAAALERVRTAVGAESSRRTAIGEARRWLPDPTAQAILEQVAYADDLEASGLADWSLASVGDLGAWRRLLLRELETPPERVSFVGDIVRRVAAGSIKAEPLVVAAREVLVPVLEADDDRMAAGALKLASRLLAISAEPLLLAKTLNAAKNIGRSTQPALRAVAITILLRLQPDTSQLPLWLLEEDDLNVQDAARTAMSVDVARLLTGHLKDAVRKSSTRRASRLARLLPDDTAQTLAVDLVSEVAGADPTQTGTAFVAIEMISPRLSDEALSSLKDRVLGLLDGPKGLEMWRVYCRQAAPLTERRLGVELLQSVQAAGNFEHLAALAEEAAQCWPTDINPTWSLAWAELKLGRTEDAANRFSRLADEYTGDINNLGLTWAFGELGDAVQALRHARLAVEHDEESFDAHFLAGWYAYVENELDPSIASSRRAIELNPSASGAYANLGLALLCRGRAEEAWAVIGVSPLSCDGWPPSRGSTRPRRRSLTSIRSPT